METEKKALDEITDSELQEISKTSHNTLVFQESIKRDAFDRQGTLLESVEKICSQSHSPEILRYHSVDPIFGIKSINFPSIKRYPTGFLSLLPKSITTRKVKQPLITELNKKYTKPNNENINVLAILKVIHISKQLINGKLEIELTFNIYKGFYLTYDDKGEPTGAAFGLKYDLDYDIIINHIIMIIQNSCFYESILQGQYIKLYYFTRPRHDNYLFHRDKSSVDRTYDEFDFGISVEHDIIDVKYVSIQYINPRYTITAEIAPDPGHGGNVELFRTAVTNQCILSFNNSKMLHSTPINGEVDQRHRNLFTHVNRKVYPEQNEKREILQLQIVKDIELKFLYDKVLHPRVKGETLLVKENVTKTFTECHWIEYDNWHCTYTALNSNNIIFGGKHGHKKKIRSKILRKTQKKYVRKNRTSKIK